LVLRRRRSRTPDVWYLEGLSVILITD
jgi:hypothetical protein